jgi:tetratricopeptide (TPR) repeat protein
MPLWGRFLGGDGKAGARGLALLEQGRFDEAADLLRGAALGAGGVPGDSLASYHFRQALVGEGRRLLRSGEAGRAVPWLAEAASLWPDYADLQFLHGASLLLGGGSGADDALGAARRSLRLNPDYLEARLLEAVALQQRGRAREAAAALDALVESGRRVKHWLVAELTPGAPYRAENVPADLDGRLRRVVSGSSPKEDVAAAVALCRAGHWADGLARFEELVRQHPRYPDYRTRQAAALYQLGRGDEALAAVDAALALNENYSVAQDLRGLVLCDVLRVREARDHFRAVDGLRAGQAAPGAAPPMPTHELLFGAYLRALASLLCGEPEAAFAALPASPDLGREFARAELLRAAAEDLAGRRAACARRLAWLAEAWPGEPLYQHLLVCHLLEAGQVKEAVAALGRWPGATGADPRPLYLENELRLLQRRETVAPSRGAAGSAAAPSAPAAEPGAPVGFTETADVAVVADEAWQLQAARAALRRGEAAAAWDICAGLEQAGWTTEPLVALRTQAALRLDGGPAAGWEPPAVAPLADLAARVAWLHARGRGAEAERLAAAVGRLHPERVVGWWLSVRFWLAPVRGWVS